MNKAEAFVDQLLAMTADDNWDDQNDYVFEGIDEMLRSGEFSLIDEILEQCVTKPTTIRHMIAMLTITLAARSKLNNRTKLFNKVDLIKDSDDLLTGLQ